MAQLIKYLGHTTSGNFQLHPGAPNSCHWQKHPTKWINFDQCVATLSEATLTVPNKNPWRIRSLVWINVQNNGQTISLMRKITREYTTQIASLSSFMESNCFGKTGGDLSYLNIFNMHSQ